MYQIRYEQFSESYPKFRSYKTRAWAKISSYIFHKKLKEIISYADEYPKYKNIFLLDDNRFSFARFDIFEHFDEKFSLQDLQDIIRQKWNIEKKRHELNWEKLVSYIDTIYVNGEAKKYVIGEKGDIFFRLYMVYIQKTTLNQFNSTYGNVLKTKEVTILPQSFHSLLFLRNTLKKENFLLMYITDTYCKVIKEENWFYQSIDVLNLGTHALRQMYKDNDILEYRNKSYDDIEANELAKNLVKKTLQFYVQLLCKRMFDKNLVWTDIILVSSAIKNGHFLEVFNDEYNKYANNYIVPFHYSNQISTYGQQREPEDIDALVMMNRLNLNKA